jgi:hypothetical protein
MASIALALLAAVLFAVSAAMQHRAARTTALRRPTHARTGIAAWLPVLGVFAALLRSRLWLWGQAANVAGFAIHAWALRLGSISVVQAVLVVQLVFALPLANLPDRSPPLRRDWVGTLAVCAGLIGLLTVRGDVARTTATGGRASLVVVVVAGTVAVLVAAGRLARGRPQLRTAMVAVAAGTCFCLTATFLVYLADGLAVHGGRGLVGWPLLGLVASTGIGGLLAQDAFAGGSLPTALTAMTITDPVASWLVGAALFDVASPTGPARLAGLVGAAAVVALGVVLLANSPTLHDEQRLTGERTGQPESPTDVRADGRG